MPGILPFSGYFYAALYITPLSVNRNLQMILWNFPYFSRLSKPLLILNIRKVARGYIHFVAYLFPAFLAPFPGCLNCFPKSLKVVSWYWSFCHIHSPYYILLFTFLFGYVYTVPLNSLNTSYNQRKFFTHLDKNPNSCYYIIRNRITYVEVKYE